MIFLEQWADRLAEHLVTARQRIVFAESCTAGLVSATLAQVPGVSEWLCGSAVTYRARTKIAWLDVSEGDLHRLSAVSDEVARQMAMGVLARTPEADLSVSITGHLGPNAPTEADGLVFIGAARRVAWVVSTESVQRIMLKERDRVPRQREAAARVLQRADSLLQA